MLALKPKQQVDGKDTRFQYNGHEIDEERIERACKTHKELLYAPTEVPACITALTPPCQSPRVAKQNATFDYGIFSFSTTSSAFFGPTLYSKDLALMTDIGRGVDPSSSFRHDGCYDIDRRPRSPFCERHPGIAQEY
ncbi:hypothetical protein ABVK25_006105 [Lepraria finkii]|uniref:Uncharacterized protein n=1 Tax=Lepraria finkii TaxID=1340010 RepID=A0ABR4B6I5_9LECA